MSFMFGPAIKDCLVILRALYNAMFSGSYLESSLSGSSL